MQATPDDTIAAIATPIGAEAGHSRQQAARRGDCAAMFRDRHGHRWNACLRIGYASATSFTPAPGPTR